MNSIKFLLLNQIKELSFILKIFLIALHFTISLNYFLFTSLVGFRTPVANSIRLIFLRSCFSRLSFPIRLWDMLKPIRNHQKDQFTCTHE